MFQKRLYGRPKASRLAKHLLPVDRTWCTICHMVIEKKHLAAHNATKNHILAKDRMQKMETLSLKLWEKHRGSALSEESGNEESVESEFRKFRESQQQREFNDRRLR